MSDDGLTPGEIQRTLARIESGLAGVRADLESRYQDLANRIGPISELKVHVQNAKHDIDQLADSIRAMNTRFEGISARISRIEIRAAGVAGGVTTILFLIKLIWDK